MKRIFLLICLISPLLFANDNDSAFKKYEKAIIDSGQFPLSSWLMVASPSSRSSSVNVNDCLSSEATKINKTAEEARKYLKSLPPKDVWCFTIIAFEKQTFKGMKNNLRLEEINEAAKKAGVTPNSNLFNFEEADLYTAEAENLLCDKCGLEFGCSYNSVAMYWTRNFNIPVISSPRAMYYWWYEGRKYLPEIWNDWYSCWQKEQSREKPRKVVFELLAEDLNQLSYHIAPFVYKAIKDGDGSLTNYFKGVKPVGGIFSRKTEPYTTWWEREQKNCALPACEGLDAASKRLGNMEELFNEDMLKMIQTLSDAAKEYYSKPRGKTDYWYYNLVDDQDYSGEDASQKLNEAIFR
jgi:hypothetical protein